jgi:Tfp pilus assembly protein PilZ
MRLRWPKSWQCSKCNKCLGWVFNHDCRFKNTETNKINRDIDEEILLKVTIDSKDIAKDVFMKVVWTSNTDESGDYYDVGLNFVKKDRDAEEAISVIISKEKK